MSYISNRDGVVRTGEHVDALLNKIEDLTLATSTSDGLLSKEDKSRIDNILIDEELTIEEISGIIN